MDGALLFGIFRYFEIKVDAISGTKGKLMN